MKRYDEMILNKLLDRYENSSLYRGENQVRVSIYVPISAKTLPEYFDETSTVYDVIHTQLREAEQKGYLTLVWRKKQSHILEKCVLNPEKAEEIYTLLHRKSRKEKMKKLQEIAREYQPASQVLGRFLSWMLNRMEDGKSVRAYADENDPEEFASLCRLIAGIENNPEECFLRQLSIRIFHDSKTAEALLGKAIRVLQQFRQDVLKWNETKDLKNADTVPEDSGTERAKARKEKPILEPEQEDACSVDEVLAEYQIYRNPSWIMLKGTGAFCVNGKCEINLPDFTGGMGVSSREISHLQWRQEPKPSRVITIENLTSFHQWKHTEDTLVVYIGGFVQQAGVALLKEIFSVLPGADYGHFGDMDCGGFEIWKNLCEKTGIPFHTILMDESTLDAYQHYGRPLTENDRHRLLRLMEDPFYQNQKPLFQKMLDMNCKLEQECIQADGICP